MMQERQSQLVYSFRRLGAALAILVAIAISAAYCAPLFENSNWGVQDWDQHLFYHQVPRDTVVEYHELPLWNPYACGGLPMLGNPQSRFMSPFFLLHLVFGVALGLRLEIVGHLALGLVGMYLLARRCGAEVIPAVLAGAVFAFSTYFVVNLAVGMTVFLPVAYLPLLALFVSRGLESSANLWVSAALLALILGDGGHYVIPIALTFVGVFTLVRGREMPLRQGLLNMGKLVALFTALAAVKLFPALELMSKNSRRIDDYSGYSLESLAFALFARDQSIDGIRTQQSAPGFLHGISYAVDENGVYIGFLAAALFLVGIVARGRQLWRWVAVLLVFLWLSFGDRVTPSLWAVLHAVPPYSSMRVATRFRMIWIIQVSLFAGLGLQHLVMRVSRDARVRAAVAVPVVLLIIVDLFSVGEPLWRQAFPIPPLAIGPKEEFRQTTSFVAYDASGPTTELRAHNAWSGYMPAYLRNLGTINCYEPLPVRRAATPSDSPEYRGEAYITGTTGDAKVLRRTPNTLLVEATLADNGMLVINQNFARGWRSSEGTVDREKGLLVVKLGPGAHTVSLRYTPTSFLLGLGLSLATIAIGLTKFRRATGSPVASPQRDVSRSRTG